eukprot:GDKI01003187.1.p1 GENE.GDKI01003187.1~~GDKI01003187.1.p1  ORF type:complete len:530 (-),score=174.48 GDKI01003187.1:114-1703(-)
MACPFKANLDNPFTEDPHVGHFNAHKLAACPSAGHKGDRCTDVVTNLQNHKYDDGFFDVSGKHGFYPKVAPLRTLPEKYAAVQHIIDEMPVEKRLPDGTVVPGLLATRGKIQEAVSKLPNLLDMCKAEEDKLVLQALYRSYTFIASAYVLEPAHQDQVEFGRYGRGLSLLPANVAQPLCEVSRKMMVYPWLDYHFAYGLGNWYKKDESKGMDWDNLEICAKFSGGPDERGFITLHIDINQHSANLVASIQTALEAIEEKDQAKFIKGMRMNYETMVAMNKRRRLMWEASRWNNYNDFRLFIMGIKDNTGIFGPGVVYEGTETGEKPRAYRGESGAQDDIVPCEDTFTGVADKYPDNLLTRYLLDLRTYRPQVVQHFLSDLTDKCTNMMQKTSQLGGAEALASLLGSVDEVHEFRNGHWMFVQKYIMPNTKYELATGGTPITSWLPNQISATLSYLEEILAELDSKVKAGETLSAEAQTVVDHVRSRLPAKKEVLAGQLAIFKDPNWRDHPDKVYQLNGDLKEFEERESK